MSYRGRGTCGRGHQGLHPHRHGQGRNVFTEAGQNERGRGRRGGTRGGRGVNDASHGNILNSEDRENRHGEGGRGNAQREMTFGRLKTWAEMEDAGELVLFMTSQRQQIVTFLDQIIIKVDWMTLLVKALSNALTAQHQKESIKNLLDCICKTKYFEHLASYIQEKLLGCYWADAEEFYTSSVNIMEEILNKLPEYALKCCNGLSNLLNAATDIPSVKRNEALLSSLIELSKKAKEVFLSEKEKEKRAEGKFLGNNDSEKPPDNFIELSVVPSKFDLSEDAKPFLRRAKVFGQYDDVEHYLDVQFRLMRQDFVLPLREGIVDFKKNGHKKNYVCSDLRIYCNVHIIGMMFKDGIDHILQFDVSKLKNIRWEFSKRLIFGSLLCLSKNNFETVVFATVAHRDAKDLARGIVNVNFKTGLEEVFNSTSGDVYIMAETTAYFESYCHVLEGLKEMSKNLPLQDYIVKCRTEVKPPHYLLPSGGVSSLPVYDLSALMTNKQFLQVAALTTVKWPQVDDMCLNPSQRDAAIQALTKELAIIQGPPGTGKTYVGLKVMRVLIENMHVISGNERVTSPILVVCYTNHALDQFLEGVLEFCPSGIVRVGGKKGSPKLEPYNLRNLKEKLRKEKLFSNVSVRHSKRDCIAELKNISEKIDLLSQRLDSLEIDAMSENELEQFMKVEHFESLTAEHLRTGQNIRKWLNASKSMPVSVVPQMIRKHLTMLVLKCHDKSGNWSLTPGMNIFQRASLYNNYLTVFKQKVWQNLRLISQYQPCNSENMQYLQELLITADKTVLPDDAGVIPSELMKKMWSFLKKDGRLQEVNHGIVETWLLGPHGDLHGQLDNIQLLMKLMSGDKVDDDDFDDDDASKQAQNARMIDDDDDEDDDDDDKYQAKSKAAMNNLSSVIVRAEMLGIKDEILLDENTEEDEEWTKVSHSKPMSIARFQKKLKSTQPMTSEMEDSVSDVWSLDSNKRFALYALWIQRYKESISSKMCDLVKVYTSVYERKKEINTEEVLFLLRSAKVIGMTTTGAAKHRAVLQSLGCRIVVVEEAAEVLESHIVTALNKNCKHLILIGDHQQLRPNPTVYLLAKEYGLEISLFERLIKNKVPYTTLKEQHRMRPEISKIMRHIYPDLQDHSSVCNYDHIRGVSKDVFFIQHEHKESHVDDSRSKANLHEAQFLVALCQYLLNQGYNENQITILATYTGQILMIKKVMKEIQFNHQVRVTAVDNFQGEENEIILLSLVRSNTDNNVGFLKVDNRVCVALSRAKKGLYISGNIKLLASQSKLWQNIMETATQEQVIGEGLAVSCQNHPEFKQVMTLAGDFKNCPDGGCGRPCDYRLTCGHVCHRKCHGYDLQHENYQCHKPCPKKCEKGHPCQRKCYQDCGDCKVKVTKQIPTCGHHDEVPCSLPETEAKCSLKCEQVLSCEHVCSGKCGQCRAAGHQKCNFPVEYSWSCGHSAIAPCFKNPTSYPCQKVCGARLDCGHTCTGKCLDCLQGSVHVACSQKCGKRLPCGHACSSFCGAPCLPCTETCPGRCRHAACHKSKQPPLCSHACPACKEPCKTKCMHQMCKKLCSDPCSVKPCSERCYNKVSKCQHRCASLCGEMCVCAKCEQINVLPTTSKTEVTTQALDDNEKNEASDGNYDDPSKTYRPVIKIASCNHIFYVDELDNYIKNFDPDGTSFIFCPVCQKPILKCIRYEDANKERYSKREQEKAKLKLATEITKQQKRNLLMSQKLIEDSALMSGFHTIDLQDVKNQMEMQVMSFKFKCGFLISAISSLVETSDDKKLLNLRKDAILKIKSLSAQVKKEFMTELQRFFWQSYLSHLVRIGDDHHIIVSELLKDLIKEVREKLDKMRPQDDVLDRAESVSSILKRRILDISTEEIVKAKCLLLEKTTNRAMKVLKSQDEEMLCDLIDDGKRNVMSSFTGTSAMSSSFTSWLASQHGGLRPRQENTHLATTTSSNQKRQSLLRSKLYKTSRIGATSSKQRLSETTPPVSEVSDLFTDSDSDY